MGIFHLFNKEARVSSTIRREYEKCCREKHEKKLSFRNLAVTELSFVYPGSRFLINRFDHRFMVLVKEEKKMLIGQFADHYLPTIAHLGDNATANAMAEAISDYRREVDLCEGNISRDKIYKVTSVCEWREHNKEMVNNFQSKGYAITGEAQLVDLNGGSLFLNDELIARSSMWDEERQRGYFSRALLEKVIQGTDRGANTSVLTFVMSDADEFMYGGKMVYTIPYSHFLNAYNKTDRDDFLHQITGLRDFISDIEGYFQYGKNVCYENCGSKIDYVAFTFEEMLNTPDRYMDYSDNSRYPFG